MIFNESGVTIDLRQRLHFHLETCPGYMQLSGSHFKVIDIGWYEPSQAVYYFVEVKDFRTVAFHDRESAKTLIAALVKKSAVV